MKRIALSKFGPVFPGGLLCLLLFPACSGKDPIAPVSGTVTLQGKPIAECVVTFQPTATNQVVSANARTDARGHFVLETIESPRRTGAAVGEYKVLFAWVDPEPDERNPKKPPYVIPPKYQQEGIPFIVSPKGNKDIVFDLQP